jgi:hypothetical protein
METNLARHRAQPCGVRGWLVDADDAELAGEGTARLRGEADDTANLQSLRLGKLPRQEDRAQLVFLSTRVRRKRNRENEKSCEATTRRTAQ